ANWKTLSLSCAGAPSAATSNPAHATPMARHLEYAIEPAAAVFLDLGRLGCLVSTDARLLCVRIQRCIAAIVRTAEQKSVDETFSGAISTGVVSCDLLPNGVCCRGPARLRKQHFFRGTVAPADGASDSVGIRTIQRSFGALCWGYLIERRSARLRRF